MLKKILERSKKLGFDDLQVSVTSNEDLELNLFNGNLEKNFLGKDKKYIIKGIINDKSSTLNIEKNDG